MPSGIKPPFRVSLFVLALAGIRRHVAQVKTYLYIYMCISIHTCVCVCVCEYVAYTYKRTMYPPVQMQNVARPRFPVCQAGSTRLFKTPSFVLALAGIRWCVAQIKTTEKEDLVGLQMQNVARPRFPVCRVGAIRVGTPLPYRKRDSIYNFLVTKFTAQMLYYYY